MIFLKKFMEIWFFYIFRKDAISFSYYLLPKKAKMIFSRKELLKLSFAAWLKKIIFILENMIFLLKDDIDWYSRLTIFEESQWFSALLRRTLEAFSYIALHWRINKQRENLTDRTEVWLLLQFMWLEIFWNE